MAQAWWPLAASWLLMSVELPATSAVVARLAEAEIHLAAYGGVVFPLALIIESPVIMLLAASTALSRDWDSFARLRRFMLWTGGLLTGLHALIAFTPLYGLVVAGALGVPAEVVEPARLGLMIMTPWTWSIASAGSIRACSSDSASRGPSARARWCAWRPPAACWRWAT